MKGNFEYLGTPSGMLKVLEIIFVIVAFSIFRGVPVEFSSDENASFFGCGVLVACMIVTPLLLVCYLMGKTEIQETIMEFSLNILFFIFLFSVSIETIDYYRRAHMLIENRSAGLSLGSFCFLASMAYLLDTFFSGKNLRDAYYGN